MAYLFNNIDLTTYGIKASRITGSNIPLIGSFDLPARIGKAYYDWGDEDGVDPYVLEEDLFFGGRNITFSGVMTGSRTTIFGNLESFNSAASAVSGTNVFATPYGNHNVYVVGTRLSHFTGVSVIDISFREPIVDLTGGMLPAVDTSAYTIDGIPFIDLGLYPFNIDNHLALPEMKQMYFTKIESEGYQNSKRKFSTYVFQATLIGSTLTDFKNKIKALYLLFGGAGLRTFSLNGETTIECFCVGGFQVANVYMNNVGMTEGGNNLDLMIGTIRSNLIVTSIT